MNPMERFRRDCAAFFDELSENYDIWKNYED